MSCTCRGCILETVNTELHPEAACSMPAFAAQRSTKPCTMEASRALLSRKLTSLVLSILGQQACIFNDQVTAMQLAFTDPAVRVMTRMTQCQVLLAATMQNTIEPTLLCSTS